MAPDLRAVARDTDTPQAQLQVSGCGGKGRVIFCSLARIDACRARLIFNSVLRSLDLDRHLAVAK
jgi:hypothetical protein